MDKQELVISLRAPVFGDRGTDVIAAFDYAESIINALSESSDRGPVWTAVHVLANTIANAIETLPAELVGQLPAPPAEVRIAPDNPAAGVTDLESAIIRLIDSRIAQSPVVAIRVKDGIDDMLGDSLDALMEGKITEGIDDFIANQLDDEIQKYMDNSVDFTEIVRDEIRSNITFTVEVD